MDRDKVLLQFKKGPDVLEAAINDLSEQQWMYRPFQGAWSIHEHIIHLVESDINNFIRWRSIIGQPGSEVFVILDEEDWARRLVYDLERREEYLQVFKLIRSIGSRYLTAVPPHIWEQDHFIYKYQGVEKNLNLLQTIGLYAQHVDAHLKYIERNLRSWREKNE